METWIQFMLAYTSIRHAIFMARNTCSNIPDTLQSISLTSIPLKPYIKVKKVVVKVWTLVHIWISHIPVERKQVKAKHTIKLQVQWKLKQYSLYWIELLQLVSSRYQLLSCSAGTWRITWHHMHTYNIKVQSFSLHSPPFNTGGIKQQNYKKNGLMKF